MSENDQTNYVTVNCLCFEHGSTDHCPFRFYRPQRSWAKVIHFYTCLSFCSRGGLPQCILTPPPPKKQYTYPHPSRRQTPPRGRPPKSQTPKDQFSSNPKKQAPAYVYIYERPVRILLEYILVVAM